MKRGKVNLGTGLVLLHGEKGRGGPGRGFSVIIEHGEKLVNQGWDLICGRHMHV